MPRPSARSARPACPGLHGAPGCRCASQRLEDRPRGCSACRQSPDQSGSVRLRQAGSQPSGFFRRRVRCHRRRIRETFEPLVTLLRDQDKALRIGVNHGSLAERMLFTYGDTPRGMVESALEFIRICDDLDFHNIVISMKASRAPVMLAAYRLMADTLDAEGSTIPCISVSRKPETGTTAGSRARRALPPCWLMVWATRSASR